MDNPGFLERATAEDEDDDEHSLPDEAFALSAATPICERSREDDCPGPWDYYNRCPGERGAERAQGFMPGGRVELPTKGL